MPTHCTLTSPAQILPSLIKQGIVRTFLELSLGTQWSLFLLLLLCCLPQMNREEETGYSAGFLLLQVSSAPQVCAHQRRQPLSRINISLFLSFLSFVGGLPPLFTFFLHLSQVLLLHFKDFLNTILNNFLFCSSKREGRSDFD